MNIHNTTSEDVLFQTAVGFYQMRDFAQAEKALRQLLADNPKHAQSLHIMAAIGFNVQRYDFAEEYAHKAITADKSNPLFYNTMGLIYKAQGKIEDALSNLKKATELDPNRLDAILQVAQICAQRGAVEKNNDALDEALKFLNRALVLRPDENTYTNIAYVLNLQGNYPALMETNKACLSRYPNSVRSLLSLASCHAHFHQYEEALKYLERAAAIEPGNGEIYAHMASALKEIGQIDESISMQKKAFELAPDKPWIYSNMLLSMVYASSVSPEELAKASRAFGERIADPLLRKRPFQNSKNPDRKLRIGYVSPDFRTHPVVYFLAPVYHRDKENFEIFAYSRTEKEDSITDSIKPLFDGWRDIKHLSDDAAADLIEQDKIDILVDLAGHTGHNSLLVFARKPAPVQVSWLGHPATTGMKAMDYRITDAYAEPAGMTEHLNVEELWRLPDIFCSYLPRPNSPAVTGQAPFEKNGYITFGCFNNFTKVTDPVLQTWAKIMDQVPDSRLLLEIAGIESKKICTEIEDRLKKNGLPMERVKLEPRTAANQYALYNEIDIALDPFPCAGGTTSFDTLWMGVPFVTLAGNHFVSRMGVTILNNAGMPELVATNIDGYISIAADLARDQKKLRGLRDGLREKFAASPAMDQQKFAKAMEAAYRQMWEKWVGSMS